MIRIWLLIAGVACGVVLAGLAPALMGNLRSQVGMLPGMAWLMGQAIETSAAKDAERRDHHHDEGTASPIDRSPQPESRWNKRKRAS